MHPVQFVVNYSGLDASVPSICWHMTVVRVPYGLLYGTYYLSPYGGSEEAETRETRAGGYFTPSWFLIFEVPVSETSHVATTYFP